MSNANLLVCFPDGTIRYGIYDGTFDLPKPKLYADRQSPWAENRTPAADDYDRNDHPVPVEMWTDYGRDVLGRRSHPALRSRDG
jgi:hypothetical protein